MKAMLYKEFKLSLPAGMYLWAVLGILSIIPNYTAFVGFIYTVVGVFVYIMTMRENRDLQFSAILPVSRKTIVTGKCLVVLIFQLLATAFAVIGAIFANLLISPNGNLVGTDPNFAFFGIILVCLGVYNIILLPTFFKSGYKIAKPIILGCTFFTICFLAFELPIQLVPTLKKVFDTLNPSYFGYQMILLFVGAVVYSALFILTVKLSIKNFEKANL